VEILPSRRRSFGKFNLLAIALRRRSHMFQELLCRLRLRHNISTSGGPAGGRFVAVCLGQWRALPMRGPPSRVERPHRHCALVIRHFFNTNTALTARVYA